MVGVPRATILHTLPPHFAGTPANNFGGSSSRPRHLAGVGKRPARRTPLTAGAKIDAAIYLYKKRLWLEAHRNVLGVVFTVWKEEQFVLNLAILIPSHYVEPLINMVIKSRGQACWYKWKVKSDTRLISGLRRNIVRSYCATLSVLNAQSDELLLQRFRNNWPRKVKSHAEFILTDCHLEESFLHPVCLLLLSCTLFYLTFQSFHPKSLQPRHVFDIIHSSAATARAVEILWRWGFAWHKLWEANKVKLTYPACGLSGFRCALGINRAAAVYHAAWVTVSSQRGEGC